MRKITVPAVVVALMLSVAASHAQVYNTAQKLREGTFRLCLAPLLVVDNGDVSPGMYALGGFGVTKAMDLYFTTRLASDNRSNFGFDLQWVLARGTPALSLTTGAHVSPGIGIDGTLDIAFPVGNSVVLYGGGDMDIDFHDGETTVPVWLFFGPRVQIRRNVTLFMEVDLGLTDSAPSMLGLGLSFYL
jgi:hypothetical protein